MNSCDVYIFAPIAKLTCEIKNSLGVDILKLYDVVNKITEIYKARVDIYSLDNVKINSVLESCKKIDEAACTIIIAPSDNILDFMILIGHAIARNKKIYILLINDSSSDYKITLLAKEFDNVCVDCVNPLLIDFDMLESFILSAIDK